MQMQVLFVYFFIIMIIYFLIELPCHCWYINIKGEIR